jgi:lipid-A-disaccharide synthase
MNRRKDLLIFSNGPGEVSTWVKPFVEAVRARADIAGTYRVILIMHPCQFGSGTEHRVGRSIDGIEQIVGKRAYMKMLLTGIGKRRYNFTREGIIFSLGGNLMHPVLFRKRIRGRHQLYAYSHNPGWERQYKTIFVRNSFVKDRYLSRGVPEEKLVITGDLVYSSLKHLRERNVVRRELGIGKGERMIVFLPGSREYMTKYLIPLFLKVIDDLTDRVSGLKPFLLKSPYISYEHIEESLAIGGKIKGVDSITGTLHREDGQQSIYLPSGKRVAILEGQLDLWSKGVDFAVSIPGTNTVQLAYPHWSLHRQTNPRSYRSREQPTW